MWSARMQPSYCTTTELNPGGNGQFLDYIRFQDIGKSSNIPKPRNKRTCIFLFQIIVQERRFHMTFYINKNYCRLLRKL